jgi:hypothetical protein
MPQYEIRQFVNAPNAQVAGQIGQQMRQGQKTVTVEVPVSLGAQYVTEHTPIYDPDYTALDRVVKHIIVSAVLYYVGKSLKDWAKK